MTPRGTLTASMWLSILYIFVFYNRYNQEVALSRSFRMVERKAAEKKANKERKKTGEAYISRKRKVFI